METELTTAKLSDVVSDNNGAELTNRLIDGDPGYEYPEWQESGRVDGVPVYVYYRTTPADQKLVNESDGDWGLVSWADRVDRIEINLVGCEREGVTDATISAVIARFN